MPDDVAARAGLDLPGRGRRRLNMSASNEMPAATAVVNTTPETCPVVVVASMEEFLQETLMTAEELQYDVARLKSELDKLFDSLKQADEGQPLRVKDAIGDMQCQASCLGGLAECLENQLDQVIIAVDDAITALTD